MCKGSKYLILCVFLCLASILGIFTDEPAFAQSKVIYLTFDDGTGAISTPRILNVLRREHVHATFFVLGDRCKELPSVVRRIQREGHEIGNHGYDHRDLRNQPDDVIESEIKHADATILQITGRKPLYYRPAYGGLDRREIHVIRHMGHPVMFWTVDSLDWKVHSVGDIVRNVEEHARPGSVVLFHDGISNSYLTAQALPEIIRYYRAKGYVFRPL